MSESPSAAPTRDAAEGLRAARHERLCTAIPFPQLKWETSDESRESLAELHDYAAQIANAAIDWYLAKKRGKKIVAKSLHYLTYIFGILAALVPLLKILNADIESNVVRRIFGESIVDPGAFIGDLALVLIGIAGGFNLLDRYTGATTGWMRYITTAARLNRALVKFQFAWDELGRVPLPIVVPPAADPTGGSPAAGKRRHGDPIAQHVEAAKIFCLEILDIVAEETAVWVDDLKARIEQLGHQLPRSTRT